MAPPFLAKSSCRKGLFIWNMHRPITLNSKQTFLCTYKFEVDDGNEADYRWNMPSEIIQDGGIALRIRVQWAVASSESAGRTLVLHPCELTLYLSRMKLKLDSEDDVQDELMHIISLLIHGLGKISPQDHELAAQRLASYATMVYQGRREFYGNDQTLWMPLNLGIALEVRAPIADPESDIKIFCALAVGDSASLLKIFRRTCCSISKAEKKEVCAICLNEFETGCHLVRVPSCHHIYHQGCILKWLSSDSSCPLCRANVPPTFETSSYLFFGVGIV